jgi:hypothetical protein
MPTLFVCNPGVYIIVIHCHKLRMIQNSMAYGNLSCTNFLCKINTLKVCIQIFISKPFIYFNSLQFRTTEQYLWYLERPNAKNSNQYSCLREDFVNLAFFLYNTLIFSNLPGVSDVTRVVTISNCRIFCITYNYPDTPISIYP